MLASPRRRRKRTTGFLQMHPAHGGCAIRQFVSVAMRRCFLRLSTRLIAQAELPPRQGWTVHAPRPRTSGILPLCNPSCTMLPRRRWASACPTLSNGSGALCESSCGVHTKELRGPRHADGPTFSSDRYQSYAIASYLCPCVTVAEGPTFLARLACSRLGAISISVVRVSSTAALLCS